MRDLCNLIPQVRKSTPPPQKQNKQKSISSKTALTRYEKQQNNKRRYEFIQTKLKEHGITLKENLIILNEKNLHLRFTYEDLIFQIMEQEKGLFTTLTPREHQQDIKLWLFSIKHQGMNGVKTTTRNWERFQNLFHK